MSVMIFHEKIVPLSSETHADLKLDTRVDYSFAKQASAVPLVVPEFPEAHKDYAIVFVNAPEGGKMPVALLSPQANGGANHFVNADGQWREGYIPAFVRRYPFVPAMGGNDTLVVCIDEASPKFGQETGQPLFVPGEAQSPLIKNVVDLLTAYQRDAVATQAFCKRLEELDLFEESNVTLSRPGQVEHRFDGFAIVKEDRMRALSSEVAYELFQNGMLGMVYAHLMSLSNLAKLLS